jgi:hypothetical protein
LVGVSKIAYLVFAHIAEPLIAVSDHNDSQYH